MKKNICLSKTIRGEHRIRALITVNGTIYDIKIEKYNETFNYL